MSTDFWIEDEFDDDDISADYGKGDKIGCLFPGRCVMPEDHFESECATAEMMREMEEEFEDEAYTQANFDLNDNRG